MNFLKLNADVEDERNETLDKSDRFAIILDIVQSIGQICFFSLSRFLLSLSIYRLWKKVRYSSQLYVSVSFNWHPRFSSYCLKNKSTSLCVKGNFTPLSLPTTALAFYRKFTLLWKKAVTTATNCWTLWGINFAMQKILTYQLVNLRCFLLRWVLNYFKISFLHETPIFYIFIQHKQYQNHLYHFCQIN